jgi:hypothetical protein
MFIEYCGAHYILIHYGGVYYTLIPHGDIICAYSLHIIIRMYMGTPYVYRVLRGTLHTIHYGGVYYTLIPHGDIICAYPLHILIRMYTLEPCGGVGDGAEDEEASGADGHHLRGREGKGGERIRERGRKGEGRESDREGKAGQGPATFGGQGVKARNRGLRQGGMTGDGHRLGVSYRGY